MSTGKAIESLRLRMNIRRRDLAKILDVSVETVRRWEVGEHGISARTYFRLATRVPLSQQDHKSLISAIAGQAA